MFCLVYNIIVDFQIPSKIKISNNLIFCLICNKIFLNLWAKDNILSTTQLFKSLPAVIVFYQYQTTQNQRSRSPGKKSNTIAYLYTQYHPIFNRFIPLFLYINASLLFKKSTRTPVQRLKDSLQKRESQRENVSVVVVVHVSIPIIGDIPMAGFSGFVLIAKVGPFWKEIELGPSMASPWLGRAKLIDRGRRPLECNHGVRVCGLGLDALLLLPLLWLYYLTLTAGLNFSIYGFLARNLFASAGDSCSPANLMYEGN